MRLVLMIFAALLVAGVLISKFKGGSSAGPKPASPIVKALNESYSRPLCIYEGPFPMRISVVCLHCRTLMDAGLVERNRRQIAGSDWVEEEFDLTKEGLKLYDPDAPTLDGKTKPGLCVGKARVAEIIETLPPMKLGGVTHVSVRFTLQLFDRAPFAHAPEAAKLKAFPFLPLAEGSNLTKPMITTLRFAPDGRFLDEDPSFRFGKWINEK